MQAREAAKREAERTREMKQRELINRALGSSTLSRQQEPVMELKPVAPPKVCLVAKT